MQQEGNNKQFIPRKIRALYFGDNAVPTITTEGKVTACSKRGS
jgi:hypothetical protein